jgi:hypothetical protein
MPKNRHFAAHPGATLIRFFERYSGATTNDHQQYVPITSQTLVSTTFDLVIANGRVMSGPMSAQRDDSGNRRFDEASGPDGSSNPTKSSIIIRRPVRCAAWASARWLP